MNTTTFHIRAVDITADVEMNWVTPDSECLSSIAHFNVIKMCSHHTSAFYRCVDHYLNSESVTIWLFTKFSLETILCLELPWLECLRACLNRTFPFIM